MLWGCDFVGQVVFRLSACRLRLRFDRGQGLLGFLCVHGWLDSMERVRFLGFFVCALMFLLIVMCSLVRDILVHGLRHSNDAKQILLVSKLLCLLGSKQRSLSHCMGVRVKARAHRCVGFHHWPWNYGS